MIFVRKVLGYVNKPAVCQKCLICEKCGGKICMLCEGAQPGRDCQCG